MDILVLGGTQFVGKYLVREALNRNHNVTIFNRGISNSSLFSNIECIIGNRNNDTDLKKLAKRKWNVIIDVPYFPVNIVKKSTEILYESTDKYVFISSVSVYDVNKNYDSKYIQYCKNKLESERLFYGKELKSLVFRPGKICGEGDNTNRFEYKDTGIYWKSTGGIVKKYTLPTDFAKYVLGLIEKDTKGIYETI